MTRFVKEQFLTGGEYVSYCMVPMPCPWEQREFVARFKYGKGGKGSFVSFLVKHFTVEEYFGRLKAGETPLDILKSKGYLEPRLKKLVKAAGFEPTPAGFERYVQAQVAALYARA